MSAGLSTTFAALAASENDAAVAVLLAALDLPQREAREGAFEALLARRSERAELEILRRWSGMSDRWKSLVAERPGWISGAVRQAVLGQDAKLHAAGCEAAAATHDYDLIPVLVSAAFDKANPHLPQVAGTVLQLAELLCEELAAPRDYRIRRDPQLQRQHVLGSLERAVAEFDQHGRRELIEAFLLLASRENAVLRRILQSPADRGFLPLIEALGASSRPGVERLLLSLLDDPHAPLSAIHALARRRDLAFVRRLLRKIGAEPSAAARLNLRRIDAIPWMQDHLVLIDALHEGEQPGAVLLAVASSLPRAKAFEAVAYALRHGKVAGRRAAAQALAEFRGAEANALALWAMDDDDPQVRATAASQLRERGIPGATSRLLQLLESPHQIEREAAQASLDDFHFDRFLATFDDLPEAARQSTGPLVRRVDPLAISKVKSELDANTRSRRRRGIELAVALGAVGDLVEPLAALLSDDDQYLRIEAVRALATHDCPATRNALRDAQTDTHPLVQQAADEGLAKLARGTATIPLAALPQGTVPLSTLTGTIALEGGLAEVSP
ncbi:MAG: HEAT repeat domain-containing protein [Pirellulaceae bacterium]|nr:HEAT repeat domain-containing protein [Pirellulaceae bacterium]